MRVRWTLLMTGFVVIYREVELKNKPVELLEISSKATVPVLVTSEGKVIDESIEIMHWFLSKNDPMNALRSDNLSDEAIIKRLIVQNDYNFKYHLDRFKYASRYPNENYEYHKSEARNILIQWNSLINKNSSQDKQSSLLGKSHSMADWALWPFVRQYRLANPFEFDHDCELSQIKHWIEYFLNHKLFKDLMLRYKPWRSGDSPSLFPAIK